MKKMIFTILSVVLTATTFGQQIPNAGFENWNNNAGFNNPEDWGNTNSIMGSMGAYTITKGTPGNPGNSYLKIMTVNHSGTTIPGIAVSGSLDTVNSFGLQYAGFPFSERPEELTGNWQYMAMGSNDQGFILVLLTKWNATTMSRDTIGSSLELLQGMVMSWDSFSIPITYFNLSTPDTAIIMLAASGGGLSLAPNSYLYVDNLAFKQSNTGISTNTSLKMGLSVYPIPAKNTIMVDLKTENQNSSLIINLMDLQGRVLLQKKIKESHFILDISDIPSGVYLLKVADDKQFQIKKVTVLK